MYIVPAVQLTHVPLESTNSGGASDFKDFLLEQTSLDTERMANRVALLTPLLTWTALLAAQLPASVTAFNSPDICGSNVDPYCGKYVPCDYIVAASDHTGS